jgi:hypothetical protein
MMVYAAPSPRIYRYVGVWLYIQVLRNACLYIYILVFHISVKNDYKFKAEIIIVTVDAVPVWIWAESCVCKFLRQFSRKSSETGTRKIKHPELYNALELSMKIITSIHCYTATNLILHNK